MQCNLSTKWQKNSKTANFNKLAGNGLKMNFDEKKIFGAQAKMTFWDLASKLTFFVTETKSQRSFWPGVKKFFIDLKHISSAFGHF